MPPPSKPGPGSAKKPWQTGTRPSSGLTPQNTAGAGASKVKRSLKHSVSASVLPKQQPTSQPISFRYALFIHPNLVALLLLVVVMSYPLRTSNYVKFLFC